MLCVLALGVWAFNPYAAAVLLPAAHVWLLTAAPGHRLSRGAFVAALAVGLAIPVVLVLYYAYAWGLGPIDVLWTAFGLVAGGALGWGAALTASLFAAALCATVSVLRVRRALADTTPVDDDSLVTRGPRTYAGPGSLGGTESALRR
jgi:xanthine/uracil/vitamin C permease (AzgA family)